MVGRGRSVGGGGLVGRGRGVLGLAGVGDIGDVSAVGIGDVVGDGLDPAVGKVDGVGAGGGVSVPVLAGVEPGAGVVIGDGVVVGVHGGLVIGGGRGVGRGRLVGSRGRGVAIPRGVIGGGKGQDGGDTDGLEHDDGCAVELMLVSEPTRLFIPKIHFSNLVWGGGAVGACRARRAYMHNTRTMHARGYVKIYYPKNQNYKLPPPQYITNFASPFKFF